MGNIPSSPFEVTPALPPLEDTPKGERCALLILGVCRSWTGPRFAKFLSRYSLKFQKVQKSRGEDYAIMDFANGKDRLTAYNFLHACKLSDETFDVKPYNEYDPPPMPYAKQAEILKFSKLGTQTIIERMYPFLEKSDEERLKRKKKDCADFLSEVYTGEIEVVQSPDDFSAHYRVDLIVGYNNDGVPTVGLNTSSRVNTTVTEIDESFDFPENVVTIAHSFQSFVQRSIFPPYDRELKTGKWASISVRVTSTNKTMITIATIGSLPISEVEKLESEFGEMCDSLYWLKGEPSEICSESPHHTIKGGQFIIDEFNGLKFTIYPFTIFPFNLDIFSKMIDTMKSKANLDENTVLVDLCCGNGIVSLSLAPFVKRTIGLDSNEKNISTAMKNAEENKVMNAYFVHGTESTLLDITNNVSSSERIVCIFDTTNIGPHNEIAVQVNKCIKRISQLIYVTAAPETLGYELARTLPGTRLTQAVLFDENPLTYDVKLLGFLEGPDN